MGDLIPIFDTNDITDLISFGWIFIKIDHNLFIFPMYP